MSKASKLEQKWWIIRILREKLKIFLFEFILLKASITDTYKNPVDTGGVL